MLNDARSAHSQIRGRMLNDARSAHSQIRLSGTGWGRMLKVRWGGGGMLSDTKVVESIFLKLTIVKDLKLCASQLCCVQSVVHMASERNHCTF